MRRFRSRRWYQVVSSIIALAMLLEFPALAIAQGQESLLAQPQGAAPTATSPDGGTPPPETRELVEERTATSKEYLEPDGRHRVEVSLDPVHYQAPDGSWQEISEDVTLVSDAAAAYVNTTNVFRTAFAHDDADKGTVTVSDGDHRLVLRPLAEKTTSVSLRPLALPEASGNTVLYRNVFPMTDLRYQVGPGRVKEEIVLADATAPSEFSYEITASGLTPRTEADGAITFGDADGTEVFRLPAPWMRDSGQDGGAVSYAVTQSITQTGGVYLLRVVADTAWLTDSARVFPVVIDPTVETTSMNVDTYVRQDRPTTSYATSPYLTVDNDVESASAYQSLIKFNLPTLSEYPEVTEAHLSLYNLAPSEGEDPLNVVAYRVTSTWGSTVTWNTKPTYATAADSTTLVTNTADAWWNLDISGSVNKWYNQGQANYGVALLWAAPPGGGEQPSDRASFCSVQYATSSLRPKLTIVYTPGDPRHTTYPLGEFAGHEATATLDKARLDLETTDLAIASWGPVAALSRHY